VAIPRGSITRDAVPYENVGATKMSSKECKFGTVARKWQYSDAGAQRQASARVRFNRANLLNLLLSEVDSFDRSR